MCNFKIKCNGCGKYLTYLLTDVYKLSQDIIVVLQEKMINFTLDTDPKIGLADQYLFYFINCLYCQKLVGELIFSSNEQYERYINCCFIYSFIVTVEESNESEVTTALEEIASIRIPEDIEMIKKDYIMHSKDLKKMKKKYFDSLRRILKISEFLITLINKLEEK